MSNKITFVDMFCGIGGFHFAFNNLGAKCVFACDNNKYARQTYELNFKEIDRELFESGHFAEDITTVASDDMPDFDVFCAGFPCQPFSTAGYRKGFEDPNRGNMFFEVLRLIKAKRPRAFFLENVKGLTNHDKGRTFRIIQEKLTELGYSFHYKLVKGTDHNVPQLRARIYMVGFRDETTENSKFVFPEPEPLTCTLSDILGGKCDRVAARALMTMGWAKRIDAPFNWSVYMVDGKEHMITVDESRRLMGFPETFKFPDSLSMSNRRIQLGNAVIVPAIQATARKIIEYIQTTSDMA